MQTKNGTLELRPFDAAEYLTDETAIAEYLTASLELGDEQVLLNAISAAARARGMSQLARDSGLGRESLYKALAPGAKPRYDTLLKVIQALGVNITFSAARPPAHRVAEPQATYDSGVPRKRQGNTKGGAVRRKMRTG
jgi:probable addiction module antidote protein